LWSSESWLVLAETRVAATAIFLLRQSDSFTSPWGTDNGSCVNMEKEAK